MNTDIWGNFDYFLQFHIISQQLDLFSTFSSTRGEIHEQAVNLDTLLSFYCGNLFKVPKLPKPRYPSNANSRQRDKESLNSSTQAKPEEQLEEQPRQGAGVQPYPCDYITPPVALVQHCSSRGAAGSICSREAEEHLSGIQIT